MNKKDKMNQEIKRHGENLETIFNTGLDPVTLVKKIKRIENKVHQSATDYCNGAIGVARWEKIQDDTLKSLDKILKYREKKIPVFVNGDCRGYALKIGDQWVRENNIDIHRDFGGYGILAPDFREY